MGDSSKTGSNAVLAPNDADYFSPRRGMLRSISSKSAVIPYLGQN